MDGGGGGGGGGRGEVGEGRREEGEKLMFYGPSSIG